MNISQQIPASFLAEQCAMPFCKGCGHTHVLRKLNEALVRLQLEPKDVCLVTDIGCIGLADALFESPHTVHTTHGRSTAFATGIKLADSVLAGSKLKTIVLIGDGGAMIGLLHLVNAAQLNVDITVLLCNNFLFGMTGGQHSAFSPLDFLTPTTPQGNIVPPLDICKVVTDAHAGFVARKLATDKDLTELMAEAIRYPGFSLVEIVELCTEHGTPRNELTGSSFTTILQKEGKQLGVLTNNSNRKEFGTVYSEKFQQSAEKPKSKPETPASQFEQATLQKKIGIIIAGSAGERVQSTAGMFCEGASRSGLHCTQKNDNPVTQGSGFSLSEVCLSPAEIHYTGIDSPDVVIAVSNEGFQELLDKDVFSHLSSSSMVILDSSLPEITSIGNVYRLPLRTLCGPDKSAAAALLACLILQPIYSKETFDTILRQRFGEKQPVFPDKLHAFLEPVEVHSKAYSQ